jgi:carboxylesterase type B
LEFGMLSREAKMRDDLLTHPDPAFWGEVALNYLPWAPTIDGQTIPDHPIQRIFAGTAADIDLLVGSNTEETRLFFVIDGSIDRITDEALLAMVAAYGLPTEGLRATARHTRARVPANFSQQSRPTGTGASLLCD